MKKLAAIFAVFALVGATVAASAVDNVAQTGYDRNTRVVDSPTPDQDCGAAILDQVDDGSFENGYAWQYGGAVAPDYGAWAECYSNAFVCSIEYYFTQIGYQAGQTMDCYVWEDAGGNPGNIIDALFGVAVNPIAFWPSASIHDSGPINSCPNGSHFVGWWGNWPDTRAGWFICADEDGFGIGCPRCNYAPTSGFGTGWGHPNSAFPNCLDLFIHEWYLTDCVGEPTATEATTWGQIKALY